MRRRRLLLMALAPIAPVALIVAASHPGSVGATRGRTGADPRYASSGPPAGALSTGRRAGDRQGGTAAVVGGRGDPSSCPSSAALPEERQRSLAAPKKPNMLRAGLIRFHVYDTTGRRLDWATFRGHQENGKGRDGDNDMLVDPVTLRVRAGWPLYEDASDPVLDRPAGPAALSMAWPTQTATLLSSSIYPSPAPYVFNQLTAQQAVADLENALSARPSYRPSPAFTASWRPARSEVVLAAAARTETDKGRHGALAYESTVHAQLLLLRESRVDCPACVSRCPASLTPRRARGPAADW
jgi:hypothetical protein